MSYLRMRTEDDGGGGGDGGDAGGGLRRQTLWSTWRSLEAVSTERRTERKELFSNLCPDSV